MLFLALKTVWMVRITPHQIPTTWYPLQLGRFLLSLDVIWTTLMSSTFQTSKIWHKKDCLCSLCYLLILNILTNRSSYEAKKLCEKPSWKVSLFKLKNLIKRCLSHLRENRSFNIYIYIYLNIYKRSDVGR